MSGHQRLRDQHTLVRFYDRVPPIYGFRSALTESKAHSWALAALREDPGKKILEVATGTGAELAM